jgi:Nif-specific regulatory protein
MFEAAHGGTIFLDEIGDLSLAAQAKILRVLQERAVDRVGGRAVVPIDVRVIAATNRNLETAMREKQFRADLFFRLSVVRIQTPSLREIPEDIPVLANHFLQKHCAAMSLEPKQFTEAALQRMAAYDWPGNTRQLENEIKRMLASVRGKTIDADQLAIERNTSAAAPAVTNRSEPAKSLYDAVEGLERRMIQDALIASGGNKLKAAQALGLSRQGLFKKLKKLGVSG